jgi:pilus assembly protein TadC
MEKPIEERLAAIESGIIRLTKMQGCMFNVLFLLDKASSLANTSERAVSSHKVPLESVYQGVNYSLAFMFGSMALLGVSIAMFSLYLTTQDLLYRVMSLAVCIFGLGAAIYALLTYRRARSQIREMKYELAQTNERFASFKKEAASLDEALAQALAEWKKLVPDYSVNEFRNEATEPNDSHGRS